VPDQTFLPLAISLPRTDKGVSVAASIERAAIGSSDEQEAALGSLRMQRRCSSATPRAAMLETEDGPGKTLPALQHHLEMAQDMNKSRK
jgi:hypothetical protein